MMSTEPKICPQCGATLPGSAEAWLCPRCLLGQAAMPPEIPDTSADSLALRRGEGRCEGQVSPVLHYFGDYALLEEIARGGMGVVWKARQVSLNRIVAVKMLQFGHLASREFKERFRAEAEAAANLQHPNIVAIHEVGEHEGQQYFSMDYVEGHDLARIVRDQPLPAGRAAALLKTVAEAVHYAHQRGVLHRDLKPANILIEANDQPRVTDFGLAKRLVGTDSTPSHSSSEKIRDAVERVPTDNLTLTGQVLGTPAYMSPEQAGGRRREITQASDVYSLGAVLYFLVTGRAPFAAGSLEETLRQVHEVEPVSPHLLNPALPRDLQTICLKCLSKEPKRRYETAQVLAEELGRFLNDEPIRARPVNRAERLIRWCRRKPALATMILALLLVGVAGLAGILLEWQRAERHALSETAHRLRAEEAVTMLELQRVEDLFEKDEVTMAMAYLARMVRQQPTNPIAVRRLLSALAQRNFALPVCPPLQHGKKVNYAEFSPDGQRVVTASLDLHAAVWDARMGGLMVGLSHPNSVRIAHFSPDGSRIVTVADDFVARLWDAATGHLLGQPMTHSNKIHSVQFSPDGQWLLTASEDRTARLWKADTGEPALEPLRHGGRVNSAFFNANGSGIVTASDDGTAQVWDARTGQRAVKPFRHHQRVTAAEFSPNGKWLVSRCDDNSTCVWDISSGQPLTKPLSHHEPVGIVHFSPEGERILTTVESGVIQIWATRGWAPARPMRHRATVIDVVFSPDGERIFSASNDNTARLWDASTGEPLTAPMEHEGLVCSARFSPDGTRALTASADETARLWDVRPGAARSAVLPRAACWEGAAFSPDGDTIATKGEGETLRLWNSRTGQPGLTFPTGSKHFFAGFSPDGQRIAVHSDDHTTRIWDANTGAPVVGPLRHEAGMIRMSFSPDGQWFAGAFAEDQTLRQWNVNTGEECSHPIALDSQIRFFGYTPNGKNLVICTFKSDKAEIRDAASGRLVAQTPERPGHIFHADFRADGEILVTASEDGIACLWNIQTGQPILPPLRHKGPVLRASFSRDGRRLVTASDDGTARVWDARTGQPVGEAMNHRVAVRTAEFSPDNLLVVTASLDGTARLWDADTGRPVAEPFVHQDKVVLARFGPDGRRVFTISHSEGARVWDVPPVPCSADFQSAVSPTSSRQSAEQFERGGSDRTPADSKSATQQTRSLRCVEAAATLLADLAEAVIGKRINAQGALESVSSAGLAEVRRRLAELPREAEFTRWFEWFLADRSTRTISPNSPITIPEYITRLTEEKTLPAAREAVLLAPTNAPALAHLAEMLLTSPGSNAPVTVAEAEFLIRRAEKLDPNDAGVREAHQRMAPRITSGR